MAVAKEKYTFFSLPSLRGGGDDTTPPHAMADDACMLAENVEFYFSTLGERRAGCEALDTAGSLIEDEEAVVHLSKHNPTGDEADAELFAVGTTFDVSATVSLRSQGDWIDIIPVDPFDTAAEIITKINAQTLHGKHFVAYKSDDNTDRLHVWDGTNFRRVGMAQPPAAPVVADAAGAGAYVDTRWFRVRFIERDADDVIIRRSEPSEETEFTPNGSFDGATITRPALVNEGETDWEVEASEDGANFYKIATVDILTTTYEDNTILTVEDYEDIGVLSEDIGDYTVPYSAKYLAVDQDRLILGSSWEEPTFSARVSWTPVFNDPGFGNDERIPLDTDNFLDLDYQEGGGLTGLASPINGTVYAFKWNQIFKLARTGDRAHAYEAIIISKNCGALPGSIAQGIDEFGRACVYFLDPATGPYRIGVNGLQKMKGVRNSWRRVNTGATLVPCFGLYYPDKQQIHWWIAGDNRETPNFKLLYQVNELRETGDGVGRGLSTVANALLGAAYCGCIMSELTERETGAVALNFRPYVGFSNNEIEDGAERIQRCDVGTTDNGVEYRAIVRSKPFFLTGLLNKWGEMTSALLATAHATDEVQVKLIRDFGKEENLIVTDLAPEGTEEFVIKNFDNLVMSNSIGIQFEFSDPE